MRFRVSVLLQRLAQHARELLHVLLLAHLARAPAEAAREALRAHVARAARRRVLQPVEQG